MRAEHAQESFRVHRACADFHIVGLLKYATLLHPKLRELQNQILEIEALWLFLKFYLVFKCSPKVRASGAGARGGARSSPIRRRAIPWQQAAWTSCTRCDPVPRRRSAPLDSAPRRAAASFRGGGTSRKKARAGARRKKPASRRMACRKQRSGRTSAATRPALPSRKRNSSAASSNRRCARPRGLPAGSAGTWARRLHAPAESAPRFR